MGMSILTSWAVFALLIIARNAWMGPDMLTALLIPVVIFTLIGWSSARRSGKIRVDVTAEDVTHISLRQPIRLPLSDVGFVCLAERFRSGLGVTEPMLVVFDRQGFAKFSLVGNHWSSADRQRLIRAMRVSWVDHITEPITRPQFRQRFPNLIDPVRRAKLKRVRAFQWATIAVAAAYWVYVALR